MICCQKRPQSDLTEEELLAWYDGKVPRWQKPDRVVFVETLPLGATGKVVKATLREAHGDVLWDEAMAELQAEQGSAVLFITHDMGVVADMADRIIVMDDGRIVEEGKHDPLVAADGLYARLARLQFTDGPVEAPAPALA